jgi:hypothetical protein
MSFRLSVHWVVFIDGSATNTNWTEGEAPELVVFD